MPSWRDKTSSKGDYLKRRSFEQGHALIDAAHKATHRLFCDARRFWLGCKKLSCKRHRRCCGEASRCVMRGLLRTPQSKRVRAQACVIAGGPRRLAPASHIEWFVRRSELGSIFTWPGA